MVTALSNDFRKATAVVEFPVPSPSSLPPDLVLVKNVYAGVNASDVNFTSGRYQSKGDAVKLPFEAGFEACGVVAGLGPETAGGQRDQ